MLPLINKCDISFMPKISLEYCSPYSVHENLNKLKFRFLYYYSFPLLLYRPLSLIEIGFPVKSSIQQKEEKIVSAFWYNTAAILLLAIKWKENNFDYVFLFDHFFFSIQYVTNGNKDIPDPGLSLQFINFIFFSIRLRVFDKLTFGKYPWSSHSSG